MKTLHITNGSSAAGTLKQALRLAKDQLLVVNDVLSCGPLKPFAGMDEWRDYRQAYWDKIQILCGHAPLNPTHFERDLYIYYQELHDGGEIHIWLGTSLSDQCMLCFLAFLFDRMQIDFAKIVGCTLANALDTLDLNGIDDWVGGVHVCSQNGRMWYRQHGRLKAGRL